MQLLSPQTAQAEEWKLQTSIAANGTLTNNVNLAPAGQQQTDFVLGINPALTANLDAARLKVRVTAAPTLYTYVENTEKDYVANNFNAFASLEAAEKFFYIDGTALVQETYISPFASQPLNGASATNNRVQNTILGLSPYIKSTTASGASYLLRDDNTYSTYNNSGLGNTYINNLIATLDGPTGRFVRWGADYNYNYTQFQGQPQAFQLQLARLRATHTIDPELSVTVDGGYETNDYGLTQYHGPIYGAGFDWKPTPRTDIYANAEHRFFGTSYQAGFNHRTQLLAFNLNGSRGLQTTPQQFPIPAGNTQAVVDAIFQTRIPDPVQRQQAVATFLQQSGLPPTLAQPFTFYSNQIYVVESVTGTIGVIGVRNTLTFSASWYKSTAVTASGQALPDAFNTANDITTSSAGVSFSHQLSALTSLNLSAVRQKSYGNNSTAFLTPTAISSTQNTLTAGLSRRFSPNTSGNVGLRYVNFDSNTFGINSYNEFALLAGVFHTF